MVNGRLIGRKSPLFHSILVALASCKTPGSQQGSLNFSAPSQGGETIRVVAGMGTDAASWETEMKNNPRFCLRSGYPNDLCGFSYQNCLKNNYHSVNTKNCEDYCKVPPTLMTGVTKCHRYTLQTFDDGSVSIQTTNTITAHTAELKAGANCLTFQDYKKEPTYEPCDGSDRQRFYWDRGQNGGYGFIKTKIGMGQQKELCLDVLGGGHTVGGVGRRLNFYNCKSFGAGPHSDSNNQRFYLAPASSDE